MVVKGEIKFIKITCSEGLAERPEIVAVSKAELPGAAEVQQKLAAESGREVLLFSSVTGQGLDKLLQEAHTVLKQVKTEVVT